MFAFLLDLVYSIETKQFPIHTYYFKGQSIIQKRHPKITAHILLESNWFAFEPYLDIYIYQKRWCRLVHEMLSRETGPEMMLHV